VEPGDARIPPVNSTVCFNDTTLGAADIYTLVTKQPKIEGKVKASGTDRNAVLQWLGYVPILAGSVMLLV
jgi:hypothetical protein